MSEKKNTDNNDLNVKNVKNLYKLILLPKIKILFAKIVFVNKQIFVKLAKNQFNKTKNLSRF